jgi:hypothetical protein
MSTRLVAGLLICFLVAPASARAAQIPGASTNQGSDGGAQVSAWVIGAVNGGVSRPVGTQSCSGWGLLDGSTFGGAGSPGVINPATGQTATIFFRVCDGLLQYVWVTTTNPRDIARVAERHVTALLPKPEVSFSPPADTMIVNFETWLAVRPVEPVTATAAIPTVAATVTATPRAIEWSTGSTVAGDTTRIGCDLWGSIDRPVCVWTPAYPSIPAVTGTADLRYHATVTIIWSVSWRATTGAAGTLADLRTTTPVTMTVQEIQTIGTG